MNHIPGMEVAEASGSVGYLVVEVSGTNIMGRMLTSPRWSTREFLSMYSIRFPLDLQPEMSWGGTVVIHRRGKMFGWIKCFHVTAAWQRACEFC